MKRNTKKLPLQVETVKKLQESQLAAIEAGRQLRSNQITCSCGGEVCNSGGC